MFFEEIEPSNNITYSEEHRLFKMNRNKLFDFLELDKNNQNHNIIIVGICSYLNIEYYLDLWYNKKPIDIYKQLFNKYDYRYYNLAQNHLLLGITILKMKLYDYLIENRWIYPIDININDFISPTKLLQQNIKDINIKQFLNNELILNKPLFFKKSFYKYLKKKLFRYSKIIGKLTLFYYKILEKRYTPLNNGYLEAKHHFLSFIF